MSALGAAGDGLLIADADGTIASYDGASIDLTPEAGTADTAADIVALLVDDAASP